MNASCAEIKRTSVFLRRQRPRCLRTAEPSVTLKADRTGLSEADGGGGLRRSVRREVLSVNQQWPLSPGTSISHGKAGSQSALTLLPLTLDSTGKPDLKEEKKKKHAHEHTSACHPAARNRDGKTLAGVQCSRPPAAAAAAVGDCEGLAVWQTDKR